MSPLALRLVFGIFLVTRGSGWIAQATSAGPLGPTAFTAGPFPTSIYSSYWNNPTATTAEPQPVISDPVSHTVYPFSLTDPDNIPSNDTKDPHPLPSVASSSQLLNRAISQIQSLATNDIFGNNTCARCQAALEVAQFLALAAPSEVPTLMVTLCKKYKLSSASECADMYGILDYGAFITQVLANADVGGYDGQMICQNFFDLCPLPATSPLNLTEWFAKPKPDPLPSPRKPSGERLKVLHLSDLHIDPRYKIGAEANCTDSLCCRSNSQNVTGPLTPALPAPRYGAYVCDSPYPLVVAALESAAPLAGAETSGFNFTIYTGDLISHDSDNQLSEEYVLYTEVVLYDLLRRYTQGAPVYATLGNHDTHPEALDAPQNLGGSLANQFSWNYDHVSALWEYEGWIPSSAAQQARAHYGAYSVQRTDGLRILTLNTDFWYTPNVFNYINLTDSDNSGMLRFLTDELQDAEDAGDRAWILGHVPPGFAGTQSLMNPSNLFYQIVDRFSPHVIAGTFFGHTHEDQFSIFYANNGTVMNSSTAQAVSWISPSVTPLTNMNSGFRVYEVDSSTFEVLDAYTWFADVNSFPSLDDQTEHGPVYNFEYSTREAYGAGVMGWGVDDPLNATWWHEVTQLMESNSTLTDIFNTYQMKSSVRTSPCTGDCAKANICFMRSGSASLAVQNCL